MKKEEKREEIADWLQTYSDGDMKLDDCIEGIMQLQSNWISVEDRLPEEIERYLVVVERPDEMHPSVKTANRYIHKPAVNDRRMDANFIIHGRVTHWQPLPQPPKE